MTQHDGSSSDSPLAPTRRLAVVLVIAIVGCLAALPFRKDRSTHANDVEASELETQSRFANSADASLPLEDLSKRMPPALPFNANSSSPEPLPLPEVETASASRAPEVPPAIPAVYEPLVQPDSQPGFVIEERPDSAAGILPQELRDLSQRWPVAERDVDESGTTRARSYRIREGDTLSNIAHRYLGNYRRAGEIYAMNRSVLSRPDLLPLGQTILLPAVH